MSYAPSSERPGRNPRAEILREAEYPARRTGGAGMSAWTRLLVRLGWRSACCGARIVATYGWDRDECSACGRRVR